MYVLMLVQNTHVMSTLHMCFLKIGSLAYYSEYTTVMESWQNRHTLQKYYSNMIGQIYRIIKPLKVC